MPDLYAHDRQPFIDLVYQRSAEARDIRARSIAELINVSSAVPEARREAFAAQCLHDIRDALPDGTHLEIGFGMLPFARDSSLLLKHTFSETCRYVGIDGGNSEHVPIFKDSEIEGVRGAMNYRHQQGKLFQVMTQTAIEQAGLRDDKKYLTFMAGDGRHLPFADASLQTVYLKDVMVAPGMAGTSMYEIFLEAQRTLKRGGLLAVSETERSQDYPPILRRKPEASGFEVMNLALQAAGFDHRVADAEHRFVFARKSDPRPALQPDPERRGWLKRLLNRTALGT